MELTFLGGASEVGSLSAYLEEKGVRMLFDCGLTPSKPPKYPMKPPVVDLAFLSHAHIDHSGMIPWLCATYGMDVVATKPSIIVGDMLLEDSVKVSKLEGYPAPYDRRDVKFLKRHFQEVTFGDILDLEGMEMEVHSAGHIPGAAMFELRSDRTLLFTGDINTLSSHLVDGNSPVKCDVLVMESTYSGRDHPPRNETQRHFLNKTKEVADRGGLAIIPTFAVGRTQEMMMTLMNAGLDIIIDGMGLAVNRHFMSLSDYLRTPERLADAISQMRAVHSPGDRKDLAGRAQVVITTSGMLDGGPVLDYISEKRDDKDSAILITGFQVDGTNGRLLMDTGELMLHGEKTKVQCEMGFYDFSAHADHNELVKFVKACEPQDVVLCHGDNRIALANDLREQGFKVHMPKDGQTLELQ